MDEFDIPIFRKTYDLYKKVYAIRKQVPKQDRFTLWQKLDNTILMLIEYILHASSLYKEEKLPTLEQASSKLNVLRILVRLAYDIKSIDNKKYTALQQDIDEIGRMLGGWIKSTKSH